MILVTGATGKVGRQLISQLSAQGSSVRAVARDPDGAMLPMDVEVVCADLADPASLTPHLEGIDSVFLLWPFTSPDAAARLAPKVVEMIAQHAPRVVYLSAAAAADQPDSFWAALERLVEACGVEFTFLRPTGFAANTFIWADQIRSGDIVRWPYGQASRSLIHERDIAAVAARALTEDGHGGARYVLTGPATLTQTDQVQAIGTALGRPLRWEELPRSSALAQLTNSFGDAAFAESALDAWASFVTHPEPVTSTVEDVTGSPGHSFGEWAADHADGFR